MSDTSIQKSFGFSFGMLQRDAQRLLEALQDQAIGAPVVTRLPATFVADFTAQVALAAQLGTDKSGAVGTLGTLTNAQAAALAEFAGLASVARRAARLAFPDQDTLLRSEFMVGVHEPRNLASVLDRARAFVAACQKYSADLALTGWPVADNAELEAALGAVMDAVHDQGTAEDLKLGTTAQRIATVNALHRQCLVVQTGARRIYSRARVRADASLVEGRARFLLDEFPPRSRRNVSFTPTATVTPATEPATPLPAAA